MINSFFKSPATYKTINNTLEVILNEQRHQRSDLAACIRMLQQLTNNLTLQKQVDQFYDKHEDRELEVADT